MVVTPGHRSLHCRSISPGHHSCSDLRLSLVKLCKGKTEFLLGKIRTWIKYQYMNSKRTTFILAQDQGLANGTSVTGSPAY